MPPSNCSNCPPPQTQKSNENCYHYSGSNSGQNIIAHDFGACTMTANEWVRGLLRT